MNIAKKIKTPAYQIEITKTNYSDKKNSGLLLGKTLIPYANEYKDGKKVAVIFKDVQTNKKFMVYLRNDGKLYLKGANFIPCAVWTGFDNELPASYAPCDWTKKTELLCEEYTLTHLK